MEEKKQLRKRAKEIRSQLSKDKKALYDRMIFDSVTSNRSFDRAQLIFTYVSYNDEVDTISLIEYSLSHKKKIAVPKIISLKEGMEAIEITSINDLEKNSLGILEPIDFKNKVDISEIDLCIIPGLAFDNYGGRLGYGGGFYDRFLEKLPTTTDVIAVAYDFQVIDKVPCENHDVKIKNIITN